MKKNLSLTFLVMVVLILLTGCRTSEGSDLIGTWEVQANTDWVKVFNADGTGAERNLVDGFEGLFEWSIEDGVVTQFRHAGGFVMGSWEYQIEEDVKTRITRTGYEQSYRRIE